MTDTVRVALATPLPVELRRLITDVDPRVELLVDDALLPAQRYPGDHTGDPGFRRTPAQQADFDALLARADILYGIPDVQASTLAPAIAANPRLRWVQTMAAGGGSTVKAAGLSAEALQQVTFTTSAGVHGGPLAEFAVFGVLAGFKGLARLQADQAAHHWPERNYLMRHVGESTVLVVGLGGIGKETARLLKAFGATVLGVKRTAEPVEHVDEVVATAQLGQVVGRADAVVITLPGTEQTEKLYSAAMIAHTKPGAVLVNVGRGSVVDETAMIAALESGHLSAAYLDVVAQEPLAADSPLWDIPSVVIAPHTAALSVQQDRQIAELFADNLARFLRDQPLRNVVDTEHFY